MGKLFVDLVKAYDTVNRELLWKTMEKLGVPKKLIQVIQKLYEKVEYHMNLLGKKTSFMSSCGVKQGDNLGPILFLLYIVQAVVTTLDDKWQFTKPDFRWHGNNADGQPKKFSDLNKKVKHTTKGRIFEYFKSFYVDDAAFIIMKKEELQKAFGLTIRAAETGEETRNQRPKSCTFQDPANNQQKTSGCTSTSTMTHLPVTQPPKKLTTRSSRLPGGSNILELSSLPT
jgi:hypothetical protein